MSVVCISTHIPAARPLRERSRKPAREKRVDVVFTEEQARAILARPRFGDQMHIAILRELARSEERGEFIWEDPYHPIGRPRFRALSELEPSK